MADFYNIPLGDGNQEFEIKLGSDSYWVVLVYRESGWFLDMIRLEDGEAVRGVPLWLNTDAFVQFHYKGFGHLVLKRTDGSNDEVGFDEIGEDFVALQWSGDDV